MPTHDDVHCLSSTDPCTPVPDKAISSLPLWLRHQFIACAVRLYGIRASGYLTAHDSRRQRATAAIVPAARISRRQFGHRYARRDRLHKPSCAGRVQLVNKFHDWTNVEGTSEASRGSWLAIIQLTSAPRADKDDREA